MRHLLSTSLGLHPRHALRVLLICELLDEQQCNLLLHPVAQRVEDIRLVLGELNKGNEPVIVYNQRGRRTSISKGEEVSDADRQAQRQHIPSAAVVFYVVPVDERVGQLD